MIRTLWTLAGTAWTTDDVAAVLVWLERIDRWLLLLTFVAFMALGHVAWRLMGRNKWKL